ncbi:DNA-directed RNA polymerase III subunit RPC5-like isoform X2 [Apostichopus japonicus]
MKEGELHLTPVSNIVQFRPSFNYLDQADAKMKKKTDKENGEGDASQDEMEKEEEQKTIKVQFVRQESDIAKARREASYAFHVQKLEQEAWVPGCYIDIDDPRSSKEKEGLLCTAVDHEISQLSMLPKDYLTKLIPESKADDSAKAQMPNNVLSITQLQSMPLANQVRALLTNAKVMKFSQLLQYLSSSFDANNVLKPLQQVAYLVQGCWVVKSEVLYPKDTSSPNTGVPAEILCRGRDYLMWKFNQNRCVVRKEIASTVKLLSEDVKEILEQMARPKVNQGWEFREEYDHAFVKRYPEIVQRQEFFWNALYQELSKVLKIPEEKKRSKKKDGPEIVEVVTGPERVKAARKRSRSICHSPTKPNQAKSQDKSEEMERNPRLSADNIPDASQQDDSLNSSNHVQTAQETNKDGNGISANHQEFDSQTEELKKLLRTVIREQFDEHFVMGVSDLRRVFSVKLMELPHKSFLSMGITDRVFEEAALDIGARVLDLPWPPDNSCEKKKLFALTEGKDIYSKYRAELLRLFTEGFRHKRTLLIDQIKTLEEEPLTKHERDKIVKSMCVNKTPYWYLKGTMPTS